jgi:hypothetical protein
MVYTNLGFVYEIQYIHVGQLVRTFGNSYCAWSANHITKIRVEKRHCFILYLFVVGRKLGRDLRVGKEMRERRGSSCQRRSKRKQYINDHVSFKCLRCLFATMVLYDSGIVSSSHYDIF